MSTQKLRERCQIMLGDLDAYNGKAKPYIEVRELAERFREFTLRLGFDGEAGIVRSQDGHLPALEAMYLLGRYVEQADFDAAEEDNHGYYVERGLVDATMTFRRSLSLSLMAADFLESGADGPLRPRRTECARLDLSLALLAAKQPEEAAELTHAAVTSGVLVPSNYWRAAEVITAIEAQGLPEAADLREAYRGICEVETVTDQAWPTIEQTPGPDDLP